MSAPQPRRSAEKSRVTIAHVAGLAGVSPTTVSHVLSGKRLVGEATRERVQAAIHELEYRPNSAARQLRTNRSHMVAAIVPDIVNAYYSELTRGLADAVGADEYGTYVCNTDGHLERERTFVHDVLDRGVDGVVMASLNVDAQNYSIPIQFGTPVVCVGGRRAGDTSVDLVTVDDLAGSRAATAHLLARGARRVAMIQGPVGGGEARVQGYREQLIEAGHEVDPGLLVRGDWTRTGGRAAMTTLMRLRPRPDAVFCANDLTAIGAMDAARTLGLRVPDDVRLVGFDDVDAATIVSPPLTTVQNPSYDTGRRAGELLMSRIVGAYDGPGRTLVLPCPLIERDSA
jgi:LacI family transcriptional regulator